MKIATLVLGAVVASSVLSIAVANGQQKYFGFWDDNQTETSSFVNWHTSADPTDLRSAAAKGLHTLLEVRSLFFGTNATGSGLALLPDWEARWSAAVENVVLPLLANGTAMGVFMGDELVWNCLPPAQLQQAVNAARAALPANAIIWQNEAAMIQAPHDTCGNTWAEYRIPTNLTWFSVDIYHMNGYVEGWVNSSVRAYYEKHIFPNLTDSQRAVLVPGAFGSDVNHYPNGTYVCDRACYDDMLSRDAYDFAAWAMADARIAGLKVWNWGGCKSCNGSHWTPPHTCCMDEIGCRDMPKQRAAWAAIGRAIKFQSRI